MRLRPGSRVAVVAPGSAPAPEDLSAGLAALRSAGYVPVDYVSPLTPSGYLAAPDADRAAALRDALTDPTIAAIVCARGGYGTMRLLPRLPYEELSRPRLIVGYSDVTALHLALYRQCGWPGLAGPMVAPDWPTLSPQRAAAFAAWTQDADAPSPAMAGTPLVEGTAEGWLLPVNLSVLTRLLGTPYLPDLTNAILVIEDVGEAPYRIDRMLCHLRLSGALNDVAGVIGGQFTGCHAPADQPRPTVPSVLHEAFQDAPYPVALDFPFGHEETSHVLPVGTSVRLTVSATETRLAFREGLVG
ncbi:MAG: LD-carboxypeptidase [Bacteroidetes bacterium]|jgi:muramoyltetrapeptide carboxypeptidase|nr:LD-carboxypeptidase [Bacteroidota bacterium]